VTFSLIAAAALVATSMRSKDVSSSVALSIPSVRTELSFSFIFFFLKQNLMQHRLLTHRSITLSPLLSSILNAHYQYFPCHVLLFFYHTLPSLTSPLSYFSTQYFLSLAGICSTSRLSHTCWRSHRHRSSKIAIRFEHLWKPP
jgi:hypothetical protein